MVLMHCNFYSEVLSLSTSMYVILPQSMHRSHKVENAPEQEEYSTSYLLHGLSEDHTIWLRRTSIERYVNQLGLAVVMPAIQQSISVAGQKIFYMRIMLGL